MLLHSVRGSNSGAPFTLNPAPQRWSLGLDVRQKNRSMLTWLKRRLAAQRVQSRLKKHFASAQGSPIQRSTIAVSMAEIEDEAVQHERKELPQEEQPVFMMTYECFVMWSLKRGFEPVLSSQDTESAVVGMRNYFAKHAWYQSGGFEKIWTSIQEVMPWFLTVKGQQSGAIYPYTGMIIAGDGAGFSVHWPTSFNFGLHVTLTIGRLAEAGRRLAEEHVAITQKK